MHEDFIIQKLDELLREVSNLNKSLNAKNSSTSQWLDKEEAMRVLKCSERTLQTLRDTHKLDYTKPLGGSKFFYRRKDIEALFDENFTGKLR